MKCPHCGREIQDNETFCTGCGWKVEGKTENNSQPLNNDPCSQQYGVPPYVYKREPSRAGKIFRAVVAVLLFVGLMFGCQSCVMSGYMSSYVLQNGAETAMLDQNALADLMNRAIEATNENIVKILLIANLLTILIICLLFRIRRKNPVAEVGLTHVEPRRLPIFALFGVALNVFVSVTLSLIPLPENILAEFDAQYSGLYGGTSIFLEIFTVAVVAGITEEIIFRGIAMSRLKPALGTVGAVIVSALIFGVAHGTPVAIAYATLLGVLFSLLYNAFDSVIPSMICHVFFNATSYALSIVPEDQPVIIITLYALSIASIVLCTIKIWHKKK